jgi:hypothetical protein
VDPHDQMNVVGHQAVREDRIVAGSPELRQKLDAPPPEIEVRENLLSLPRAQGHQEYPAILAIELGVLEPDPLASWACGHDPYLRS